MPPIAGGMGGTMKSYKVSKGLAFFVAIAGAIVMLGWIFDISILKSILPGWVTMKFNTAVCFVLCGITLYLIAISFESKFDIAQVFFPIPVLIILLIMGGHLTSVFLGLRLKVGDAFIKEANGAVLTAIISAASPGARRWRKNLRKRCMIWKYLIRLRWEGNLR